MKTGEIGDNQLKASTWEMGNGYWPPRTARYDFAPYLHYSGAWAPKDDKSTSDWFQVRFMDVEVLCTFCSWSV